jgi:hypothetical protein
VPVIWIGVLAALPLLKLRKAYALIVGFFIGLLASMSLYLLYPLPMVFKLSGVMSQIALFPSALIIVIFPLFYGIIMGLSALFWAGLIENPHVGATLGKSTQGSIGNKAS